MLDVRKQASQTVLLPQLEITMFVTMSYIVAVNSAVRKAAGIPVEASMVATIATAIFGALLMGVCADRPFAIAPTNCYQPLRS